MALFVMLRLGGVFCHARFIIRLGGGIGELVFCHAGFSMSEGGVTAMLYHVQKRLFKMPALCYYARTAESATGCCADNC